MKSATYSEILIMNHPISRLEIPKESYEINDL